MRTSSIGLLLTALLLSPTVGRADPPEFRAMRVPTYPGERMATVSIKLNGAKASDAEVRFYYSTNRSEVEKSSSARAKARVKNSRDGDLKATAFFPHKDHPQPNWLDVQGSAQEQGIPLDLARATGLPIAPITDEDPKIYNATDPEVFFKWTLKYKDGSSSKSVASEIQSFRMPRVLIIAYAGDSYASGEGAPDGAEKWSDKDCHRSEKSGGLRAIKKLIADHREYAVRFVNVTCSGAETDDLASADIRTNLIGQADWSRPAQLLQIEDALKKHGRKTVDILLMSIGGNDIGFGPIGTSTLLSGTSDLDEVKHMARDGLESLPIAYEALDDIIRGQSYGVGRVVIMTYPDPTRSGNGEFCGPAIPNPLDCWGPVEQRLSAQDFETLYKNVLVKLNDEIKAAAKVHDWDVVDVANKSRTHGLCNCQAPYFNTVGQSALQQGDQFGTIHPNATGYRKIYRDEVLEQLLSSIDKWHAVLKGRKLEAAKEKLREDAKQKSEAAAQRLKSLKRYHLTPRTVAAVQVRPSELQLEPEDRNPAQDKGLGAD